MAQSYVIKETLGWKGPQAVVHWSSCSSASFFQLCLVHIFQLVNNTAICMLFVSEYLSFLTTEI